jgi:acyl carrier protein
MRVHTTTLSAGISRNIEFEKRGLAQFAVNVGTKCGHGCLYCSTVAMQRTQPSIKAAGEKPFDTGYAIVNPDAPERVARDAIAIRKRGLIQLCTTVDAWSPEAQEHDLGRRSLEGVLSQPEWTLRILTKNIAQCVNSMTKTNMAVGLGLILLLMLTTVLTLGQEVVTTKDGRQIRLNKDGTWTDVTRQIVTTKDGRQVQLNPDGTWTEVKATPATREGTVSKRPAAKTTSKDNPPNRRSANLGVPSGELKTAGKDIQAGAHVGVEQKVSEIIVEQLGVDASEVKRNAKFVDDLGADSLDMVELTMALEEAFNIEIPDKDAEKFRSVGDAIDYIKAHVKGDN